MSELRAFEAWAGALLSKLEPRERRQINQKIARALRRSQQSRIRAQKNPDGSAYTPRKKQPGRDKAGRIRRDRMFRKLALASRLKLDSTSNAIGISFMARNARIARVHHYGLHDAPAPGQKPIKYANRRLLGFTDEDLELIRDELIDHISDL